MKNLAISKDLAQNKTSREDACNVRTALTEMRLLKETHMAVATCKPILSVKSISINNERLDNWKPVGGIAAAILAALVAPSGDGK